MTLPPLSLARKLDTRIWGGDTLGPWLGIADAPANLGESWQVYDQNTIVGGPFAGRTLADLTREHGAALVGGRSFARYGADFPLLAKFIDSTAPLSIQVHPDDAYAHSVEAASGFHGKTEAWYILHTAPNAEVIHGLSRATDRQQFAAAVADGTLMELMRRLPVTPGDTIFVPAGTVHAIMAGVTLFEIQQKSDLTYRVYDYDRRDAHGNTRELHLDRALDVIDYGLPTSGKTVPQTLADGRTLLVSCPYFAMERWQIAGQTAGSTEASTFTILTTIEGDATLRWHDAAFALPRGVSLVLPASCGDYTLETEAGATLLACTVPPATA